MTNKSTAYINGKIFTSDDSCLYADAMITEKGRIVWIGKAEDMPQGEYERIDLRGKRVLPGFVDAHMHPVMLADYSKKISALPPKVNSIEDLAAEIRNVRGKQGAGQWIEGWGTTKESCQRADRPIVTIWTEDAAIPRYR